MFVLQVVSSVLLLLSKWFLANSKKKTGWLVGLPGMVALVTYFYLRMVIERNDDLWILVTSNFSLIPLMVYGYIVVVAKDGSNLKGLLKKWEIAFKAVVIGITIFVCALLVIGAIRNTLATIEFTFTVTALFGTLLLAFDKKVTNISGWALYIVTHILSAYTMFLLTSPVLGACQLLSIIFAVQGINRENKKEATPSKK